MAEQHIGRKTHLVKQNGTDAHLAFCGGTCTQYCPAGQFKVTAPPSPTGIWVKEDDTHGYLQCSPFHPRIYDDLNNTVVWSGGSRTGCVTKVVSTTRYRILGGSGDALPASGTDIRLVGDLTGVSWLGEYWDMPSDSGDVRHVDANDCNSYLTATTSSNTSTGFPVYMCNYAYTSKSWTHVKYVVTTLQISHTVSWYTGFHGNQYNHILGVKWASNFNKAYCVNSTSSKYAPYLGYGYYSGYYGSMKISTNPIPPWPKGGSAWFSQLVWTSYGGTFQPSGGQQMGILSTGTPKPDIPNRWIRDQQFGSWTDALGYTYSWYKAEPSCSGPNTIYWNNKRNTVDIPPTTYVYPYTP